MLTSSEAAKRLGVSPRRITALAKSGTIQAVKASGVWLIDEASLANYGRSVRKSGGRPRRGQGKNDIPFVLMNRTHDVAELAYDRARREFSLVGDVIDSARMPIGLMHHGTTTLAQINEWWRGRGIPVLRDNLDDVLRKAEASIPEELLYRNLGLSLSDQYWIRPAGADVRWDDVNFFTNGLEAAGKAVGSVRPRPATPAEPNAHPDNTSDGNLEKRWVERGGKRLLIKGARNNGQEPYNEAVATALHSRLLNPDDYVAYTLEQEGGRPVCACENFLTDHEEYVPAHYVAMLQEQGATTTDYRHYVECCKELGVRDIEQSLAKMIVCDDIIANHDRHWRNFGLIRNVDTLECRPAPLFDSGSSLWCDIALDALAAGGHSFTSKPFDDRPAHQLLLVDDFSWANPSALDGFVEEAVAILQQNEWLGPRIPYIRSALEHRVRRMADIIEWS